MINWAHWHNEPYLVGGLILLAWAYALATGPLRQRLAGRDVPFPRRQAWSFHTSLVLFYLAVGSPLDQIGERFLFSAHMVQHQILMYPSAILFVVGLPDWLVDRYTARRGWSRIGHFITRPIPAGILYVVTQTLWHVPAMYDWALQNRLVHVIEHVTFFGTSLLYWWPLLSPSTVWPRVSYAVRMVYLIAVTIGMTPLFAFIVFSPDILYPTYEFAPRLIAGFDPADDQLLAGAIMKLGGLAVTFITFGVVFYSWYRSSERRAGS